MKKPLLLCILDGFGINGETKGNAVFTANTPNIDRLFSTCAHTQIGASGLDVGLPDGQMGNSEVGHTNMGAGRVVYQELTRISKSIVDGDFFTNPALAGTVEAAKANGSALHLMGLLSNGGVHSHNTHLYALLELAKSAGLEHVYIHALLDGRDVAPSSGADFVRDLQLHISELKTGKIATVCGRYYAMDRDNRWERVSKAYAAFANGEGVQADDAEAAVRASYQTLDEEGKHRTDEFILPTVIDKNGVIKPHDSVVFFNFRPDRAREITRAFVDPGFDGFVRKNGYFPLYYVCMTQYDATMPNVRVAFAPQSLANTLGEYLSALGKTQLRIAETEKYAHVTFFFNGGVEKVYPGEDRVLIPSPKVPTYDLQPEMSAYLVADAVTERVLSGNYNVIILNFANCDMVGHTGVFEAAVAAVEAVDECVGRVEAAVRSIGGEFLLTADHGNADRMEDIDGSPFTAHTTNPVPFLVSGRDVALRSGGRLCDVAPTMLALMDLPQPLEMSGKTLIS
ncbi:MAG: 2,3-bisphosphoglycerate-independent phosphoglycerate mutase [Oscillospiraceae bacterium]|nr:2,3-bisphosphoglycerate-independent phosphoglycerate mutase [Oscillospiraceae bacterium]